MADNMLYFLVQWEDRFLSVILPENIVFPKKAMSAYMEGEIIQALYERKTYNAVISEIHPNRKYLLQQTKRPPKYYYESAKSQKTSTGFVSVPQLSETVKTSTLEKTSKVISSNDQVEKSAGLLSTPESYETETTDEDEVNVEQSDLNKSSSVTKSPSVTKSTSLTTSMCSATTNCGSDDWKEDIRSLRRKIRRLEERVSSLEEKEKETIDQDDVKLKTVEHLQETDIQRVFTTLARAFFTEDELVGCSRTGKRTSKCSGDARPPLDPVKIENLERAVRKKTKISRELFVKKLENLQKTLRQKQK